MYIFVYESTSHHKDISLRCCTVLRKAWCNYVIKLLCWQSFCFYIPSLGRYGHVVLRIHAGTPVLCSAPGLLYTLMFPPVPSYSLLFPPIPSYTLMFPPIPSCTLLYPPIPSYTLLFPPVPSCSLLYPPIPSCTLMFPPVPSYTLLYPHVPSYSLLFPPIPSYTLLFPPTTASVFRCSTCYLKHSLCTNCIEM